MRDYKHLTPSRPAPVPPLWGQVLLVVMAFGAGVLVNQHFTDQVVAQAHAAVRAAHEGTSTPPCVLLAYGTDEEAEQ